MNQSITGAVIRRLREARGLTQVHLAELLCVSDKTVSKWETGKGCPDISIWEPLAAILGISVAELLSGSPVHNANVSANMLRSVLYVCPVCGNVIHSMGQASVSCHGIQLTPAAEEAPDDRHGIHISVVEDEYFVRIDHPMKKSHFIRFIAALSPDRLQMTRLYPEGSAEARFSMRGVRRLLFCCNRDGLFAIDNIRQHRS